MNVRTPIGPILCFDRNTQQRKSQSRLSRSQPNPEPSFVPLRSDGSFHPFLGCLTCSKIARFRYFLACVIEQIHYHEAIHIWANFVPSPLLPLKVTPCCLGIGASSAAFVGRYHFRFHTPPQHDLVTSWCSSLRPSSNFGVGSNFGSTSPDSFINLTHDPLSPLDSSRNHGVRPWASARRTEQILRRFEVTCNENPCDD